MSTLIKDYFFLFYFVFIMSRRCALKMWHLMIFPIFVNCKINNDMKLSDSVLPTDNSKVRNWTYEHDNSNIIFGNVSICQNSTCIRKCCAEGYAMVGVCASYPAATMNIKLYEVGKREHFIDSGVVVWPNFKCENQEILPIEAGEEFYIQTNRSAYVDMLPEPYRMLSSNEYCLENIVDNRTNSWNLELFFCYTQKDADDQNATKLVIGNFL